MDMRKDSYHKITISDLSPHSFVFRPGDNKVNKIFSWLKNWIKCSLECGKIHPYDLLPTKAELAYYMGVSQGTLQNVIRQLEDAGYVESKQRIGTYIINSENKSKLEKSTTKRENAIEIIKKYISENKFKEGDILLSSRKISKLIGISNSTIMFAINNLVSNGILKKQGKNFIIANLNFDYKLVKSLTLTEKIANSLRDYIKNECSPNEKLPANSILMKKYNVSAKTICDSINILAKEGLVYTRRGQYGTIVVDSSNIKNKTLYSYEKFEQEIRNFIKQKCKIGDKIPSIREFSSYYKTSEKTIKKALNNLADDGYLTFIRGRYGGTFVTDIPEDSTEAYKWLAINTDYISN